MKATPPKQALQFLRWFCREDYPDGIERDLTEVFRIRKRIWICIVLQISHIAKHG